MDNFDPDTGEPIPGGGILTYEDVNFILYLPHYRDAKDINIYDQNFNKLLTIDVSQYSKVREEDFEEEKQKGFEEGKQEEYEKEIQKEIKKKKILGLNPNIIGFIVAGIIILILIYGLIKLKRKKGH